MLLVIPYRKRGLRSSMSDSERMKVVKMKAQLEQQIQVLEKQINLKKFALAASNRLPQLVLRTTGAHANSNQSKHSNTIWRYACARYWPDRALVFECVTCFYCLFPILRTIS